VGGALDRKEKNECGARERGSPERQKNSPERWFVRKRAKGGGREGPIYKIVCRGKGGGFLCPERGTLFERKAQMPPLGQGSAADSQKGKEHQN